ncbi:penicillin-binding protein 1A [Biformimicrobium ophioploci]|nr:penicillin-binding protein 1A [Microbulbifer sp. NKW57]
MSRFGRSRLISLFFLALAAAGGGVMGFASIFLYLQPGLPAVDNLRDVRLQTPLRIYSADMQLIGEFGEKRRKPIAFEDTPPLFVQAILAAEDDGFYEHQGVSLKGLVRAAAELARTGSIQSGGSTLTMQVARNFFLSREQRFIRKFNEILLSLQIERELTKDEILELYINKIYLGNRAYGFQAASQVYYGKNIDQLTLAQWAMMAGLPKAPSAYNPIANPSRALQRRNWILRRMLDLGHIDKESYTLAITAPVTAKYHSRNLDISFPYIAEMARKEAVGLFGESAYTDGYRVITTVDARLQAAARDALQKGLLTYDKRHGYRGPEQRLDPAILHDSDKLIDALKSVPVLGEMVPAVVTEVEERSLKVQLDDRRVVTVEWENGLSQIRPYISEDARGPKINAAAEIFAPGDIVRLRHEVVEVETGSEEGYADVGDPFAANVDSIQVEPTTVTTERWILDQVPEAQGALVALNPSDGAIRALMGGFDFRQSHFNRVTQAARQPGSSFKPFIYAAALANGYTAASIINDAPIVFDDANLEDVWRPENDGGTFLGPTRLRKALYLSRNLVSIRLLRALGMRRAMDFVEGFGFDTSKMSRDLSVALGSQALTPLEIATGYAAFANGGFRVEPYLVNQVLDVNGSEVYTALPPTVCNMCPDETEMEPLDLQVIQAESVEVGETEEAMELEALSISPASGAALSLPRAQRIMSPQVAFIMDSILKDVIRKGTGKKALAMGRSDIGGKTGTTNGPRDAWFSGYSQHLAASAWVGFDSNTPIGRNEYGGSAALPIWIDFMSTALEGLEEKNMLQPENIVTVRIDPRTGRRARGGSGIFEIFEADTVPGGSSTRLGGNPDPQPAPADNSRVVNSTNEEALPEELF